MSKVKMKALLFCQGAGGFFSRAIRVITMSRYSHVAMLWETAKGPQVVESMEGIGVRAMKLEDWQKDYKGQVWRLNWDVPGFSDLIAADRLDKVVGAKYDTLGIGAFLLRRVPGLGKMAKIDNSKYFCSELVAAVLQWGGTPLARPTRWLGTAPGLYSPADVFRQACTLLDRNKRPVVLEKIQ